jgi:hypothetical protein
MALAVATAVAFSIAGWFSIDWLFRRLGADETTLPLVGAFMRIWYLGALTMALPMMGNGILISVGDSAGASRFMIFGTVLNAALNPVMIFGLLGFPAMGYAGRPGDRRRRCLRRRGSCTVQRGRHHLLASGDGGPGSTSPRSKDPRLRIPSNLTMTLMPISSGVITGS